MTKYDKIADKVKKFVSIYEDNCEAYWGWTVRFCDDVEVDNIYEARKLKNQAARAEAEAYAVRMADVARVMISAGRDLIAAVEAGDEAAAELAYRLGRIAEIETGCAFIFDLEGSL